VTIEAEALRVLAPAKINLFLHVGDKRPDGYHALQSLAVFTRVGDEIALSPDRGLKLVIHGPFADNLSAGEDNLVLKAARALAKHAGVMRGAYLSLKKVLPVSSGIGGGSSDAAAALRGLVTLWNLKTSPDELRKIAETLGSDVPVCVACKPQWMEGRGEVLSPAEGLPMLPMVLVNPGVAVPTAKVFAGLKDRRGVSMPRPPRMQNAGDLVAFLKDTTNDLEAPARILAPAIGGVLDALRSQPGALLARMSGSGATCFAIFADFETAAAAAAVLRGKFLWVAETRTVSGPY
jgi:4-diphosphocytidyl-2-C-methyl-D-erythritol kinase